MIHVAFHWLHQVDNWLVPAQLVTWCNEPCGLSITHTLTHTNTHTDRVTVSKRRSSYRFIFIQPLASSSAVITNKNDTKMTPKWHQNDPEKTSWRHAKDTKMTLKWHVKDPRITLIWHQNDTFKTPKWHPTIHHADTFKTQKWRWRRVYDTKMTRLRHSKDTEKTHKKMSVCLS